MPLLGHRIESHPGGFDGTCHGLGHRLAGLGQFLLGQTHQSIGLGQNPLGFLVLLAAKIKRSLGAELEGRHGAVCLESV